MAQGVEGKNKSRNRRKTLLIVGLTLGYMVPLFWLWSATNFPDSFGVIIKAHGKAGLLEEWWYSYLLLSRPNALDLATFAYMWLPVVCLIGWAIYKQLGTQPIRFNIFADQPDHREDTPSS
ncbi:MAG: hypothetical protein ABGW87_11210 [Sphingomonadaceae bacterium]